LSANAEQVTVAFRVIKNQEAYSYKEVGLTSVTLGSVPTGPDNEAPEIEVEFEGTGYYINEPD
jgi:hypothetical protein